jgi:hypothetical protein
MLWNYLAFAACLRSARAGCREPLAAARDGAVLASSVAFFVISNFGMWASGYYPRTWDGLVSATPRQCRSSATRSPRTCSTAPRCSAGHALLSRYFPRPACETGRGLSRRRRAGGCRRGVSPSGRAAEARSTAAPATLRSSARSRARATPPRPAAPRPRDRRIEQPRVGHARAGERGCRSRRRSSMTGTWSRSRAT